MSLDEFLVEYDSKANAWWYIELGEMQVFFDELLERYVQEQKRVAALSHACIEARRWIQRHDDGEGEGPGYELGLIRRALAESDDNS